MTPKPLGARQAAILRAIVHQYVSTGEPVGSKHLVERSGLGVSPATVRTEMARLEEFGYVVQPHTSAGRVPTDLGYRFVVDELKFRPLSQGAQRRLETELTGDEGLSLDDLLRKATEVVSRFTHHAAAVLARRFRPSKVRRIELLSMSSRMAMAVLIADNGRVEQRMIPLEQPVDETQLDAIGEKLNATVAGHDIDEAKGAVLTAAGGFKEDAARILFDGVAVGLDALRITEDQVIVGGVGNLAGEESFEREQLQRIYESLERQTEFLELLASALDTGVPTVRIGRELSEAGFSDISVVASNFGAGEAARGTLGVIGPVRMDYARVIATANAVARMLEGQLSSGEE
jgi:heat-inducible transcriptional repressor